MNWSVPGQVAFGTEPLHRAEKRRAAILLPLLERKPARTEEAA
jgi:hypothetical protein